jgi:carbonic anhydrase
MRLSLLSLLAFGLSLTAAAQSSSWEYEGKRGAVVWGKLDPAYGACSHGHEQSPIDIRGARLDKSLTPLEFHYLAGPVTLEHDGHSIVAHVNPGSYMMAGGVRYNLTDLVFHHPSEHVVRGKFGDLEVQLMHRGADGKQAILAVRLLEDVGRPNAVLAALWPYLPQKPGTKAKVAEFINPAGLLPADPGYWTYMGSLSTPPCTEGVRWFVLEEELSLSRDQLRAFAALFRMNARPAQELHGRRIEANE